MGKSPGKWIKKVLFGKKTSKPNSSNPRDMMLGSASKGTTVTSTKVSVSMDTSLVSKPVLGTSASTKQNSEAAKSRDAELVLPSFDINNVEKAPGNISTINDSERMSLEQAAVTAQAAFRGYQARMKLQLLRGITKLQALARGHLVRRQAVATFQSVRGIIKIQALVRGQRVRHSIGTEMRKREPRGELDDQCLGSLGNIGSQRTEMLLGNAFVVKLLSSLPAAMPLQLRYEPEEPNSLWNWLNRWTMLQVYGPHSQFKKTNGVINGSSLRVGTDQARPKGSVPRLTSSDVENGLKCNVLESERFKVKLKKVTKDPVKSIQEQPQNGTKKVQRNPKNVSKPVVETSLGSVAGSERRKHTNGKSSKSDFLEETSNTVEKVIEVRGKAESKPSGIETRPELPAEEGIDSELHNHSNARRVPKEAPVQPKDEVSLVDEDIRSRDALINDKNKKSSTRRASLPAKHDYSENGLHNTPIVPSYMATTESAKAKLRAQASPNFDQDDDDKNALRRRHSLPSSNSGKFSSSPRVHKLVQASVKGGIRGERSLMSSRDSSDSRALQAEWKR